jgi:DNA mismatch repair protein MutS
MEVADRGGEVVFLRKLREGPAMESYGLHVARLAGIPERVLIRAEEILEDRRKSEASLQRRGAAEKQTEAKEEPETPEAEEQEKNGWLLEELLSLDVNATTPLEALSLLSNWKDKAYSPKNSRSRPAGAQPRKRSSPVSGPDSPSLFDS